MKANLNIFGDFTVVASDDARVKRQAEDAEASDDYTTEELCKDRPADEYFRASLEGDCRDVVR